jgi:signal transduction histidine kinase
MPDTPPDPRWPKLMSLAVHEFRTPLTVVAGYVRMLLKDRAGPVSDQQRKLLEESEKACARLSGLLMEASDLANLEAGNGSLNRQATDLRRILQQAIDRLPVLPDREVPVTLETGETAAPIQADAARLPLALASIVAASRRELVGGETLIVRVEQAEEGAPAHRILIGDRETVEVFQSNAADLPFFDEWRGGCGMTLPVARRIVNAHGGTVWSPPDGRRAGALVVLPASS